MAKDNVLLRQPIYQLKISLMHTEPLIWRQVLVSGNRSLKKIHEIIQVAMGWQNYHMHMFSALDRSWSYADPRAELEDADDESRTKLRKVAPDVGSKFFYWYDFGDDWMHEVEVKDIEQPKGHEPVCVAGEGACPPEDCGGIPGYFNFVEAMQDPKHPEHGDLKEWYGGDFDPKGLNLDNINKELRRHRSG